MQRGAIASALAVVFLPIAQGRMSMFVLPRVRHRRPPKALAQSPMRYESDSQRSSFFDTSESDQLHPDLEEKTWMLESKGDRLTNTVVAKRLGR